LESGGGGYMTKKGPSKPLLEKSQAREYSKKGAYNQDQDAVLTSLPKLQETFKKASKGLEA
jgi:hypothetical protein